MRKSACLIIIFGLLAGCSSSDEKPLRGLVIQRIEIEGDQSQAIVTALAAALISRGATVSETSGVALTGTAVFQLSDSKTPQVLTLNVRGGDLFALVQVDIGDFVPLTVEVFVNKAAERIARIFGSQFTQSRKYEPVQQPKRDSIQG